MKDEDVIAAAWSSGLKHFNDEPKIAAALSVCRGDLLPRFALWYSALRELPRGARRALARRLLHCRRVKDLLPPGARGRTLRRLARSVAAAALLFAVAQAGEAATITVTTNAPGVDDSDGNCSLAEAIVNANDDAPTHPDCAAGSGPDTIVLSKGTHALTAAFSDYAGATGLPVIASDITIAGNRAKIARSKKAPALRLMAVADSGKLTLNEVLLSGGSADIGGAILNYGSLEINDSTISGNTATKGGAIYSRRSTAQVVIHDSGITKNQAAVGGAIFSYQYLLIIDGTLSGNTASSEGGAIANYDGYLRLEHSTISKNRAARAAAGIDNVYGTAKIFNSVITGNTAMYGGGIENYGKGSAVGKLYIYDTMLAKNGAAVYAGGVANIDGYFKLADSTVTGNKANDRGGGVFNNAGATFVASNSTIAKNKAPNGADVYP
ncbi:MAG TPA: CSLREA domain-containing protein [Candidatus Binatia bacterium]|nr:CSLREA domain-containing protein [Candidatus Binatia bacterium]